MSDKLKGRALEWLRNAVKYGPDARYASVVLQMIETPRTEEQHINAAIKVLEDRDELLPIGHDCNIGMAMAIQILYSHRADLRKAAMEAAVSPQREKT